MCVCICNIPKQTKPKVSWDFQWVWISTSLPAGDDRESSHCKDDTASSHKGWGMLARGNQDCLYRWSVFIFLKI